MKRVAMAMLSCALPLAPVTAAVAQDCRATLTSNVQGWNGLNTPSRQAALMNLHIEVVCADCTPVVLFEAFVSPASLRFRSQTLALGTGTAFAQAVLSDPQIRASFLADLVHSEQAHSPMCQFDGYVEGIAMVASLGMVATVLRGDCREAPGRLRASYFSGFDGICIYRLRVTWRGWEPLPPDVQDRVMALLEKIRFGP